MYHPGLLSVNCSLDTLSLLGMLLLFVLLLYLMLLLWLLLMLLLAMMLLETESNLEVQQSEVEIYCIIIIKNVIIIDICKCFSMVFVLFFVFVLGGGELHKISAFGMFYNTTVIEVKWFHLFRVNIS